MKYQKLDNSSWHPQTQDKNSPLASRPFAVQAQRDPHTPPTQEEIENEAFNQHKFEAFGLQLKQDKGTITPVEQERLGVLQAKMDNFWAQRQQRMPGNSNYLEIIARHGQPPQPAVPVQPKLTVGEANDKYEQEADRVAARVVEQIHSPTSSQETGVQRQELEEEEELQTKPEISTLQRMEIPEEEEEELQTKPDPLQRQELEEEEEELQMSPTLQRMGAEGGVASTDLEAEINAARGSGQSLAPELQTQMGQAMGADFSGVRVHTDARSDRLNRSVGARAFTTGQDVFFKQGEYQPGNRGGQELIAHELTHVIQQKATTSFNHINNRINNGDRPYLKDGRVQRRPRRNAVGSFQDLPPEQQMTIQVLNNASNILKFNFSGSGDKTWKTHKPNTTTGEHPKKWTKNSLTNEERHQAGGRKYKNNKGTPMGGHVVYEYAGPLANKGAKDSGKNSTSKNLEDAQGVFKKYMAEYLNLLKTIESEEINLKKVQVNIKGFSRGAATASTFASWIKNHDEYGKYVNVNLVLYDPVHGSGKMGFGSAEMPKKQDVTNVYDNSNSKQTGVTLHIPVKSGYGIDAFRPQEITGAQRIIISYGRQAFHGFGIGDKDKSKMYNKGKVLKGMKLSSLDSGVYIVNVDQEAREIQRIPNYQTWLDSEKKVLAHASGNEGRKGIIRSTVQNWFNANHNENEKPQE